MGKVVSKLQHQNVSKRFQNTSISRAEKPLKTKVGIVSEEEEVELQCQQTALENPLNLNLRNISQEHKKHARIHINGNSSIPWECMGKTSKTSNGGFVTKQKKSLLKNVFFFPDNE